LRKVSQTSTKILQIEKTEKRITWTLGASNVLKCCAIDCRKGSRHVTNAKLPAKLDTIKWAAVWQKECHKSKERVSNVERMSNVERKKSKENVERKSQESRKNVARMSQECRKNVERMSEKV